MPAFFDILVCFGAAAAAAADRCRQSEWTRGGGWSLRASRDRDDLLTGVTSGPWTAWVLGEIYRYGARTGTTEELARSFFEDLAAGREQPAALCGSFAIVARDEQTGHWSVWTDLAGSIHIYWTGGVFGSFSRAVYGASRRQLDWEAITAFCCHGFFPQDRTYYGDVRLIRPASRYEFDAAGRLARQREYWTWRHRPEHGRDEAGTIAEFGRLLQEILQDQTRIGTLALPLSGGLDSRTVAAALPAGARLEAYSYGYAADSIETRIASEVARASGLSFRGHVIGPYLLDGLDAVLDAVEGFQDVTQARQAAIAGWLDGRADYLLAGHWGDVLCDEMGCAESGWSEAAVLEHALGKFRKRGRKWLLDTLCRPHLGGEDPEQVAGRLIGEEMAPLGGIADADFRVKALKTRQWAHRWTLASLRMYQAAAFPRLPFLDPRMLEFFTTVPTERVRGRRLQIEYLKRLAPQLARVAWQSRGTNLFGLERHPAWRLPGRVASKLKRLLSGEPPSRNWEVQFFSPGRQEQLAARLGRAGRALHEFLPPQAVGGLLERFARTRTPQDGYAVSMVLTLDGWMERFHAA